MPRSVSLFRRYTPPTCTLEVTAKRSPLSQWAAQPVAKDIRFQLSLDAPTVPKDQWAVIKGDRAQLADLGDAVSAYVQRVLEDPGTTEVEFDRPTPHAIATLPALATQTAVTASNATGISLQAQGLLKHTIHWGNLATAETGPSTQLSTLQLFDLANALDEYATDLLDLPELESVGWMTKVPNWAQVAALVLITVGVSTSAIRLLDQANPSPQVASNPSQGASSSDQQIATQIPPAIVEKATPPVVSTERLPSPSPGITPHPTPGKPTVAVPTKPTVPSTPGTSSGPIANYPVPITPGQPTIIAGETEPPAQPAPAPPKKPEEFGAIASRPADAAGASLAQPFAQSRSSKASEAAPKANSSAFDTIPQVSEVRSYFQNRWTPPDGLDQTLEYSLQLDKDGTLKGIVPLKQAAGDYLDRTGMPLLGDPFVSPLQGRETAKIRLVLDSNGNVKTFLEE